MNILLFGMLSFTLGSILYILGKMQDYRQLAKSNKLSSVVFNAKQFFLQEWINMLRLFIAGFALVIFAPMLAGERNIAIMSEDGITSTVFSIKEALIPFYFLIGYGGNSAIFNLFGKYKKTFLNQAGISDSESVG